jgi:hypothetical protein
MRSSLRLRAALVVAALGVSMFASVLPANAAPKASVGNSSVQTGGISTLGWTWIR